MSLPKDKFPGTISHGFCKRKNPYDRLMPSRGDCFLAGLDLLARFSLQESKQIVHARRAVACSAELRLARRALGGTNRWVLGNREHRVALGYT